MAVAVAAGVLLALTPNDARSQQPPPGVVPPPFPPAPAQPPGPGSAPRLPAAPIAPPPSVLPPPVAAAALKIIEAKPLTPGKLDPASLSWPDSVDPDQRAARTPEVSVNVVGDDTAKAAGDLKPAQRKGRFESVGLLLSDDGARVPATQVILRFRGEQQGKTAWVHPLDGGSVDDKNGGRAVNVGPGGVVTFTFQPPAQGGLYHVTVRLDGITSTLPFEVRAARELAGPRSSAQHLLPGTTLPAAAASASPTGPLTSSLGGN